MVQLGDTLSNAVGVEQLLELLEGHGFHLEVSAQDNSIRHCAKNKAEIVEKKHDEAHEKTMRLSPPAHVLAVDESRRLGGLTSKPVLCSNLCAFVTWFVGGGGGLWEAEVCHKGEAEGG
eukprot:2647042-Amphidinium_carterae.1